jgi:hypothetical protein
MWLIVKMPSGKREFQSRACASIRPRHQEPESGSMKNFNFNTVLKRFRRA